MESLKLRSNVSPTGVLHVQLPADFAGRPVEITVAEMNETSNTEDWQSFIRRMYGCMADDSLDRPEQLPFEDREAL